MKTKKIKKKAKKAITQKQKQIVTVNIGSRPAFRTPKRRRPPQPTANPQVIYKVTPVSQPNFQSIGERVAELAEVNKLASRVRGLESTLSSAREAEGLRVKPETETPNTEEGVVRVKQESSQTETVQPSVLIPKSTPTRRSVSPPAKARDVSLDIQVKRMLVEKLGPNIVGNIRGIPLKGSDTDAYNDALRQFLVDGNVAGLKEHMKPSEPGTVNRAVFEALFSRAEGQPMIDSNFKKTRVSRPQSTK